MQEVDFEHWLRTTKRYGSAVTSNGLSRCRRVERYEGDLDDFYRADRMESLLSRLAYSSEDEAYQRPPRHAVPITEGANVRNGTASIANAVRLYRQYLEGSTIQSRPTSSETSTDRIRSANPRTITATWPAWTEPANHDC